MNKTINIVIGSSKEYAAYAQVLLVSLFENSNDEMHIYYYHSEKMDEELEKVGELAEKYGNKLYPMKVDEELFRSSEMNLRGWNYAVWYRWLCVDQLWAACERVLILGIDIIVNKNISEFYFQDMTGKAFVLGRDMGCLRGDSPILKTCRERGKDPATYGNTDICLIDLKKAHEIISFEKLIECYNKYKFTYLDQDVINYCFESYVKVEETIYYNFMTYVADEIMGYDEALCQLKKACIIHYAGPEKPWRNFRGRASEWLWREYAKKTSTYAQIKEQIERGGVESYKLMVEKQAENDRMHYRLYANYAALDRMMNIVQANKAFKDYFESRGIQSVVLYGAGSLCRHFIPMIRDDVEIRCIVDAAAGTLDNIEVVPLEALSEGSADLIIVTPVYAYDSIKEKVSSQVTAKTVSLMEILEECD